jgi:microcystin-dependent protein
MDEYIGTIKLFAGNYAPHGWMHCMGQILPIQQYQALYAVIGNTYGGNPGINFMLPDLRGRVVAGFGEGRGLQPIEIAEIRDIGTHGTSRQQAIGMNYIICVEGLYPSRD